MVYRPAEFVLNSVDHGAVLLGGDVKSARHLVAEDLPSPMEMEFTYELDGEKFTHTLRREAGSVAADAELILLADDGSQQVVKAPEMFNYYNEDRTVSLSFIDHDRFQGMFVDYEGGRVHHLNAENGELTVDADARDYLGDLFNAETATGRSLRSSEKMAFVYWSGCYPGQTTAQNAEIAMGGILGYNMYQSYGTSQAAAFYNSYIRDSNIIYENQMSVTLSVKSLLVATGPNAATWANPGCGNDISTVLNQFRAWSKPSTQDIWHMVDDCFGTSGSTLGIAYVGALCSTYGVGVNYMSEGKISTTNYPTWATVAHEIGHNFNAQHSFEFGQGVTRGIMDYGPINNRLIDGTMQFNTPLRKSEVCSHLTNRARSGCLATARFAAKEIEMPSVFRNVDVDERPVNCQRKRNTRPLVESDIGELFTGASSEMCRAACARAPNCSMYVYNEVDTSCGLISEIAETVHAGGVDTYTCIEATEEGVAAEIAEESIDDLLGEADAAELMEFCCTLASDTALVGENIRTTFGQTVDSCNAACVKDTACTGVTFDDVEGVCLFYGTTLLEDVYTVGSSALECSRDCIRSTLVTRPTITTPDGESSEATDLGAYVLGGVAVGLFTIVAAFLATGRRRGQTSKSNPSASEPIPLSNPVKNHLFEE